MSGRTKKNGRLSRVLWCKKNECLPYIMRDENCHKSNNKGFYANLAAWCNRAKYFKTMTFQEFMKARTTNIATREKHIELLKEQP